MKKLIAFFLLITICMSLTFPASAVDSVDENQWTYAPVEMFANNSAQEGSARAGIEVDMYRSSYKIPDSTSMLSRGIVSDGIITYEIRVGILVTNNGTASANQSVTWSTTAASTQAKFISGDSKTNSYGQAFAYFHVRNLASLPVRAVCAGVTTNTSIEVPTEQLYNSSFYITYYIVADENDYPGSKTESIPGVSGLFKPQFLAALRLNGSGRDTSNRYLSYYGGTYSLQNPTTASGTTPTVGQTIAVDPFYIPMVNRSGWKRGAVDIMTTGLRRAEDTGGAIDDFHIDVYVGVGMSNVTENNHNSAVLFKGVNTWGSFSNSSYSAENYWNEADLAAEKSVKTVWNSENEELCAFVSIKDYTNSESRIEVTVAETTETNNAISRLSLSTFALNLIDVTFINDSLIGIESYINPSTNVYEIFDLNTGTVVDVYYGHGFTHYGDTIYYIQSPQHFSGIRGKNRILTSTGILVYESDADVTISATLDIKNDNIYFMENNSANGEKEMRNIKICNNIMQPKGEEVYYY